MTWLLEAPGPAQVQMHSKRWHQKDHLKVQEIKELGKVVIRKGVMAMLGIMGSWVIKCN